MPVKDRESDSGGFADSIDLGGPSMKRNVKLHVVVDGVQYEMETLDSFAIKFGLLTSMPVSKVKHLLNRMPATLWTGDSRHKAQGLLSLVEEAGGKGRIVEEEVRKSPVAEDIPEKVEKTGVCVKCGFPLKDGDKFCEFCQSPIGAKPEKIKKAPRIDLKSAVPPARLLFLLLILFAAVVITVVVKS